MSTPPLPENIREFLRKPSPCVVGTLGKRGQPVTAATWFYFQDDDTILLNIEEGRARVRQIDADPRVALTVMGETWYAHVSIQGRVTDVHVDTDMTVIDHVAQHYTGKPYPVRDKARISQVVTIDRYFTWNVE
jgi:PPOX class probable F420-dependent enzyme